SINYGAEYFKYKPYQALYLHASDNWLTDAERYSQSIQHYMPFQVSFDQTTCRELALELSTWVVPTSFTILVDVESKPAQLDDLLTAGFPVDLLAYACRLESIADATNQQHLTGLMLACYLGKEAYCNILLKHGAEVDRCMLHSGDSAFT